MPVVELALRIGSWGLDLTLGKTVEDDELPDEPEPAPIFPLGFSTELAPDEEPEQCDDEQYDYRGRKGAGDELC